jgi:hypothetical protein
MMHRISVNAVHFDKAWRNFVNEIYDYDNQAFDTNFDENIAKHNAVNVFGTEYIDFYKAEDVTAFVLRYGR